MPDYRYVIVDEAGQFSGGAIKTSAESLISSGASPGASPIAPVTPLQNEVLAAASGAGAFIEGAGKRAISGIAQVALAPLNTATGGLAMPVYSLGRTIAMGASAGAIGGAAVGVAIAGIQLLVRKIEERMAKFEDEALRANNHDNLLIRAGIVQEPTYYSASFRGVKSTTRS